MTFMAIITTIIFLAFSSIGIYFLLSMLIDIIKNFRKASSEEKTDYVFFLGLISFFMSGFVLWIIILTV